MRLTARCFVRRTTERKEINKNQTMEVVGRYYPNLHVLAYQFTVGAI